MVGGENSLDSIMPLLQTFVELLFSNSPNPHYFHLSPNSSLLPLLFHFHNTMPYFSTWPNAKIIFEVFIHSSNSYLGHLQSLANYENPYESVNFFSIKPSMHFTEVVINVLLILHEMSWTCWQIYCWFNSLGFWSFDLFDHSNPFLICFLICDHSNFHFPRKSSLQELKESLGNIWC